jgi:ectoine hydroxylase-related dioxygenase (phytanoyl-CoA dioxygenase family)
LHGTRALDALDLLASRLMDQPAIAVRAILFDKTPQSNWAVPWHQDLAVPVLERHELPGYRAWSLKERVWHVQPPQAVLEAMLTLRLHLDDCTADNAPLQVVPGSHALGRLDAPATAALLEQGSGVECTARTGDVLAMRPLLLHASAKARQPWQRRVLHVEYAAQELPAPLRWHRAWPA